MARPKALRRRSTGAHPYRGQRVGRAQRQDTKLAKGTPPAIDLDTLLALLTRRPR
jgi:hypothetical protein